MPGKTGKLGGKRNKRAKAGPPVKREIPLKEDCMEYGQVLKLLGNCRFDVQCFDGVKRLCHVCGKMRKKVWVVVGDIVLVSLREFQDAKGDIIVKYTADEAKSLKNYGELPTNVKINETVVDDGEEEGDELVEFTSEQAEVLDLADI